MPDWRQREARVRLMRLAIGGWAAQALFAAGELGVFELLESPRSAEEVARELGAEADGTRRLLGALVAAGVLEHDGELFSNGPATSELLVAGKPRSMTTWLSVIGRRNQALGALPESVRSPQPDERPGGSGADTRELIIGMHEYAMGPGRELASRLGLNGRAHLLDVGGGAGTYSILLASANPSLRCAVVDLPDVVPIARQMIERHGLQDRVTAEVGDYNRDEYGGSYDVALVSNVLHQENWGSCVALLRRVHDALEPGGLLVVHAMFLNELGDGPLWPALHNLVLLRGGGRAYSVEETTQMLAEAGFEKTEPHWMSPFNAGSFVTALKP